MQVDTMVRMLAIRSHCAVARAPRRGRGARHPSRAGVFLALHLLRLRAAHRSPEEPIRAGAAPQRPEISAIDGRRRPGPYPEPDVHARAPSAMAQLVAAAATSSSDSAAVTGLVFHA